MVKRLRLFASMGRLKRLALVLLARTITDKDVVRLRVRDTSAAGASPRTRRSMPKTRVSARLSQARGGR